MSDRLNIGHLSVVLNLNFEPFPIGAVLNWLLLYERRALTVAEVQGVVHVGGVKRGWREGRGEGRRALVLQPVVRWPGLSDARQPRQQTRVGLVYTTVTGGYLPMKYKFTGLMMGRLAQMARLKTANRQIRSEIKILYCTELGNAGILLYSDEFWSDEINNIFSLHGVALKVLKWVLLLVLISLRNWIFQLRNWVCLLNYGWCASSQKFRQICRIIII